MTHGLEPYPGPGVVIEVVFMGLDNSDPSRNHIQPNWLKFKHEDLFMTNDKYPKFVFIVHDRVQQNDDETLTLKGCSDFAQYICVQSSDLGSARPK